jgi:trans-2,3-dihydro-3-hydroxyanthranilate isomerase
VRTLRYVICDVFTDRPLQGNPLCVFTDARGLDPGTMQALARELRLSETSFILPPEHGGHARLRIFTPTRELPFAGHPVLGTAFVLGGPLESTELRLELAMGIIPVRLEREGARVSFGWMTQPAPAPVDLPDPGPVLAALGLNGDGISLEAYDNGARRLCIEVPAPELVRDLTPDFAALARATKFWIGVFHQAASGCLVRYFVPAWGIDEDPATGAFAGVLARSLWSRGRLASGEVLRIEQGAQIGRPSTLYARVSVQTDGTPQIEVGGAACIVARGQFVF